MACDVFFFVFLLGGGGRGRVGGFGEERPMAGIDIINAKLGSRGGQVKGGSCPAEKFIFIEIL